MPIRYVQLMNIEADISSNNIGLAKIFALHAGYLLIAHWLTKNLRPIVVSFPIKVYNVRKIRQIRPMMVKRNKSTKPVLVKTLPLLVPFHIPVGNPLNKCSALSLVYLLSCSSATLIY